MKRLIVDCTTLKDDLGRTILPVITVPDLTPAEQAEYDALQLLPQPIASFPMVAGRIAVSLIDGFTKAVTFSRKLNSADYVVTLTPTASLSVNLWATNKTTDGFTLNLSVAIAGTIEYIAHEVT